MSACLRRIWVLMVKEFLALLKEPRSRFVIFGPPLIQTFIFSYAATYDLTDVPYAVYNEDPGDLSRRLIARLEGSQSFRRTMTLTRQDQIDQVLESEQVLMVVHFGPDFTRQVQAGRGGQVQVVLDGRNSNTALVALGYVRNIVTDFSIDYNHRHGRRGPPAQLETVAWYNRNLQSIWYIVPGIVGLLTLVVTLIVTSLSVAREREQGTFDQILVTPLRPWEICVGKALPGFLIGLFESVIIVALAVWFFRVPLRGNLAMLFAGISLFLASAVGIGLMISSLSATMQQALLGAFLFLVPSVILSGFTTPIANMPWLVRKITLINPMRYFMVIVRGVFLEAAPAGILVHQLWPMAIMAAVSLIAAGWLFRHRTY